MMVLTEDRVYLRLRQMGMSDDEITKMPPAQLKIWVTAMLQKMAEEEANAN